MTGCGLRYMDGDIFKKHKASCIILKISILSAELKRLTGLRQGSKIDNTEFILRASEAIRLTLPAAQKYKIKKPEKVKSSDAIEKTKLEDENLDDLETTRTFKGTQI